MLKRKIFYNVDIVANKYFHIPKDEACKVAELIKGTVSSDIRYNKIIQREEVRIMTSLHPSQAEKLFLQKKPEWASALINI